MQLDLDDFIPGSVHFRWREALWLDTWKIYTWPDEIQYQNIIKTAKIMDAIRNRVGAPLIVTSWLRPFLYNKIIGGAPNSQHLQGLACDFKCYTISPYGLRDIIRPELDRLNIRMEKDTPGWVHCDLAQVRYDTEREFRP